MNSKQAHWSVGVFGDSRQSGPLQMAAKTRAVAIFGDSELDLRSAVPAGEEISVRAVAGFGDVRIIVPPGSRVAMSGFGLFGSKRSEVNGAPGSDGVVVRVKAWAFFGDVRVV